ncbi:cation:proton antiporter [Planctobacterium marinum]
MDFEFSTELLRQNPFYELTALLGITAIVAFLGNQLRQPIIVSFIAVGVLVGPSALDIVHSDDSIALLAQLGIAILLFLVGLKLDLKLIRTLGVVAVATGLGQVFFTSLIGFGLCLLLGFDPLTSLYVAVALTLSSTIIIVKMLTDKREVDALHGKIAIGFLIVQDLVVVIAMVVLSATGIGQEEAGSLGQRLVEIALGAGAMLIVTVLFIRYWANPLMAVVARSQEQLLIFAVALATVFATLGHLLGFSKELGGLLAGVALASTPYREAIISKLASLRDFLLLFFFIALGSQLDLSILGTQIGPALLLSFFVLIGNPLIVMIIMGLMGYRNRTGFLAGLTVAQISEFSLIFIAMGITIGHLNNDALGLVTLVGLITIALSVYMISHSHYLYEKLSPWLAWFDFKVNFTREVSDGAEAHSIEVLVCGAGRYGSEIIEHLLANGVKVGVIDFNPDKFDYWRKRGVPAFFGGISDAEFISHLSLNQVKWFVATLPRDALGPRYEDPRRRMLSMLKENGFSGQIAMAVEQRNDAERLQKLGVDTIMMPYKDAASLSAQQISDSVLS